MDQQDQHHLSERDRREIAVQVDEFVQVLANRYGVTPADVVETVRWVKAKKDADLKMQNAGTNAIIGLILTAVAIALWEGFKLLSRVKGAG